jgi:hypothetical protein
VQETNILMAVKCRTNYRESGLDLVRETGKRQFAIIKYEYADRTGRNLYQISVTHYMGKDRLLLNYDVTQNKNNSTTLGNGPGFL